VAGAERVEACVRLEQSRIGDGVAHQRVRVGSASGGIEDTGAVVEHGW
jgi:hypothetical protein